MPYHNKYRITPFSVIATLCLQLTNLAESYSASVDQSGATIGIIITLLSACPSLRSFIRPSVHPCTCSPIHPAGVKIKIEH